MINHKKILLVDDEEGTRLALGWTLENRGFSVTTADNGVDALKKMNGSSFDLVITDLVMEEMGGMDLLEQIKKQRLETAVIILTGFGNVVSAVQTLKLGADDYIQKPCDVEELCDRIGKVLEKQDLIKQVDHQMKQLTREKIQRKRVEQELLEWQGNIELYVSKRTMELSDARKELADLLEELKVREMELEEKNRELTDTNNALATLLRRREKEHSQIKTDIANQAAESVFPLLRKAERLTVSNKVKENLVTAQANLMELFVSHTGDNRLANARLAPRELQVINYIKQNKSSKEIAELLGLSVRTIESYRENIRKKLQIKNTKKTLKKFLISTL